MIRPAKSTDAVLSLSACLQRKQDNEKDAKSTTQEEFEDNMVIISAVAAAYQRPLGKKALFCYDNNTIQKNAVWARMGITHHQKVSIPTHSPDFNKPIEHVFNRIKQHLRERIYSHVGELLPVMLQNWVVEIFNGISAGSIAKDVASLKRTYRAVSIEKGQEVGVLGGGTVVGTGGDWPPAHDS